MGSSIVRSLALVRTCLGHITFVPTFLPSIFLPSPLLFQCARYPVWDTHPVHGIPFSAVHTRWSLVFRCPASSSQGYVYFFGFCVFLGLCVFLWFLCISWFLYISLVSVYFFGFCVFLWFMCISLVSVYFFTSALLLSPPPYYHSHPTATTPTLLPF